MPTVIIADTSCLILLEKIGALELLPRVFGRITITDIVAAYNAMLAFKKYKQSPVIFSRDGRIVAVPPEDMPPAPPLG